MLIAMQNAYFCAITNNGTSHNLGPMQILKHFCFNKASFFGMWCRGTVFKWKKNIVGGFYFACAHLDQYHYTNGKNLKPCSIYIGIHLKRLKLLKLLMVFAKYHMQSRYHLYLYTIFYGTFYKRYYSFYWVICIQLGMSVFW